MSYVFTEHEIHKGAVEYLKYELAACIFRTTLSKGMRDTRFSQD